MKAKRFIRLSIVAAAVAAVFPGCSKEQPAPAKAPETATTPTPSPTPPAVPAPPAPAGPVASANDQVAQDLASKSGCLACHAVDKKVIGPSYKEIAQKYSGQSNAEAMLIKAVKNGSHGKWGPVPMPPNAQVKDEDAKTLVNWVLGLK